MSYAGTVEGDGEDGGQAQQAKMFQERGTHTLGMKEVRTSPKFMGN